MSPEKVLHDVKTILRRLEIMAELLRKQDFKTVPKEEIQADIKHDLAQIEKLMKELAQ